MSECEDVESVSSRLECVVLRAGHSHTVPNGKGDNSPSHILRIKEQMANQCFEMKVKLSADTEDYSGVQEEHLDQSECEIKLQEVKVNHCNKTLAIHRMQMWHAISEKLKQDDTAAAALRTSANRTMEICSKIMTVQQESRELEQSITKVQKERLDLKRLIHEKMKELEELKWARRHPEEGKYAQLLQKGQSNLDKYKRMVTVTQNVLRGTILASKVNWRDDPKLKDIALGLEDIPNLD